MPVVECHYCPCLCLDALSLSKFSSKSSSRDLNFVAKSQLRPPSSLVLGSSFVDAWHEWRLSAKILFGLNRCRSKRPRKIQNLVVVSELGGQYEEGFDDVTSQILNYFTIKAVRTVLNQLYEMNPSQYRWFYNFLVRNHPGQGKRFIRNLGKEKQELAEKVMIIRLHLYSKWVKKCDHAKIYQYISDQNLELMRERLMDTVIWPSEETNT